MNACSTKRGAALLLAALVVANSAMAAGLLIPTGQGSSLTIAHQRVDVQINDAIAITTVTQVFRNHLNRPLEARYVFPIPPRASVSNFSLWINGEEVVGEVLEKQRARDVYEAIVEPERGPRRRKDPGLLEETDAKTFEMRVFPVPANGEQQVQITYYQPVDYDSGLVRYVYPLALNEPGEVRMDGPLTITVDARSRLPVARIVCPTHEDMLAHAEQTPNHFRAGIEEPRGRIDRDFVIYFELERSRFDVNLITYSTGDEDGYFNLLLTPGEQFDRDPRPLNAVFVLDTSGSMADERKLSAACRAAWAAVQALRPEDVFNVVAFNLGATPMADKPIAADAAGQTLAERFLSELQPRGGTDLVPALSRAAQMHDPERQNVIVVLSDGEATQGDDHSAYVALLREQAPNVRIASIGIGNDVNRPLLDRLARDSGGFVAFLSAEDDVADLAPLLLQKLRLPLAADIQVSADGVQLYDLTPLPLPNLFHGGQFLLFGRYRGSGPASLLVSALIAGEEQAFELNVDFPKLDLSAPEIARMWAWHRIADLMRDVHEHGESPALREQIVALGTTYSITSRYTSFLVLENEQMYRDFDIQRRNKQRIAAERQAQAARQDNPQPGRTYQAPRWGGGAISPVGLLLLGAPLLLLRRRKESK